MAKKVAARSDEIAIDSFSQLVMPSLQQQGWQQRELKWEDKLTNESARIDKITVFKTINALESFLVSWELQCKFFLQRLCRPLMLEQDRIGLTALQVFT